MRRGKIERGERFWRWAIKVEKFPTFPSLSVFEYVFILSQVYLIPVRRWNSNRWFCGRSSTIIVLNFKDKLPLTQTRRFGGSWVESGWGWRRGWNLWKGQLAILVFKGSLFSDGVGIRMKLSEKKAYHQKFGSKFEEEKWAFLKEKEAKEVAGRYMRQYYLWNFFDKTKLLRDITFTEELENRNRVRSNLESEATSSRPFFGSPTPPLLPFLRT